MNESKKRVQFANVQNENNMPMKEKKVMSMSGNDNKQIDADGI